MSDIDTIDGRGEIVQNLVILVGRRVLSHYKTLEKPKIGEVPPYCLVRISFEKQRNAVLELVEESEEYSTLLNTCLEYSETKEDIHRQRGILNEFVNQVFIEICRGNSWDHEWVTRELTLMGRTLYEGLIEKREATGLVIPLFNFTMIEYQVNLGEFGILRRVRFDELLDFSTSFSEHTHAYRGYRFKYVLDIGPTELAKLFPINAKYWKV